MSFETFVGLRFLKPRRKQLFISIAALISIIGIAVGVASLIVVIAVVTGFQDDLREKILGAYSHILVLSFETLVHNYEEVIEKIERHQGVVAASPFVYSEAMLTSGSDVSGVVLRGIDPARASRVTSLAKSITQGSLYALIDQAAELESQDQASASAPTAASLPGIILGKELAANLRVFLGDSVNLVSPLGEETPMGNVPKIRAYRVAALFDSGMYEFDSKFAFISLKQAQDFFKLGDAVSGIEVRVDDIMKAKAIARAIQAELGFPYRTKDWMEMNRNLFSALKLEKLVMFIILTIIVFVAALNIFSTLYMVVMDKQRSIAMLKTMGASARQVMRIFTIQGLYIGVIGSAAGLALGFALCLLQIKYKLVTLDPRIYYISELPMKLHPADFLIISLAALVLSFLATLAPSRIAARVDPVEVLRYE